MKRKPQILKWLVMLLVLIGSSIGAMAAVPEYCEGTTKTYSITSGVPRGNVPSWSVRKGAVAAALNVDYSITGAGTASAQITWKKEGSYTVVYTETTTLTGCFAEKIVDVIVNPAPLAPVSGGDQIACEQSPLQTLTATATAPEGSTVVWYTLATGGTVVDNPTLHTVGTVTYYAQSNGTTCNSLTRTPVTLTINPLPKAITGTFAVCEGSTTDLDNATSDGTWSSSNEAIATVDVNGIVHGVSAGNVDITYMLGTGCNVTVSVTVSPVPNPSEIMITD